ncbi:hypothetical protein G210_2716, partial [Candida maltosa Xu316]
MGDTNNFLFPQKDVRMCNWGFLGVVGLVVVWWIV